MSKKAKTDHEWFYEPTSVVIYETIIAVRITSWSATVNTLRTERGNTHLSMPVPAERGKSQLSMLVPTERGKSQLSMLVPTERDKRQLSMLSPTERGESQLSILSQLSVVK